MSIEEELRNRPYADHTATTLGAVDCPRCGTANEQFKPICFMCGARLIPRAQEIKPPSELATTAKGVGILAGGYLLWVLIYGGALCFICFLISQWMHSSRDLF